MINLRSKTEKLYTVPSEDLEELNFNPHLFTRFRQPVLSENRNINIKAFLLSLYFRFNLSKSQAIEVNSLDFDGSEVDL